MCRAPSRISLLGVIAVLGFICFFNGCQNKNGSLELEKEAAQGKVSGKAASPSKDIAACVISAEPWTIDLKETLFQNGQERGTYALPETIGGGLALIDFDRDGRLDLVTAGGGAPNQQQDRMQGFPGAIMRHVGPNTFESCREFAYLDFSSSYNEAIIANDYDNDGFVDLLVTGYSKLQLFRNQGDGTFESTTEEAQLLDQAWSSSAAFFDADMDGDLDLYVVHYANWGFDNNPVCRSHHDGTKRDYCGPRDFQGLPHVLYENLGDGTFADVTQRVGMTIAARGLGVLAADLDEDNKPEIYVANDVAENLLYQNKGNWRFDERGVRSGVACDNHGRPEGSMGIAIGDYNLDGKLDLFVTNYESELCALYRNDGKLNFTYASNSTKIGSTDEHSVSWGTAFNDLDLDGDEDLLVINGHLESYSPYSPHLQLPQALENIEGKYFRLSREKLGSYFNTPQGGRGLALGDLDNDGLVDFGVSRINEPAVLVRNTSRAQGGYVTVRLVGWSSNRDAVGTRLSLRVGTRTWVRQVIGGGSYASTSDPAVHFGIPKALLSEPGGELTVHWSSGLEQKVSLELNKSHLVVEGL